MKTSEVLYTAADLIEERGWGHGPDSMFGKSGVCIMGAIHASEVGAFGDDYGAAVSCPAGRAVYDYLQLDPQDQDAGWEWNDAWRPGVGNIRTAAEVIEVLRAAAVIEAAKEQAEVREPAPITLAPESS